jgi:hypothetical protein
LPGRAAKTRARTFDREVAERGMLEIDEMAAMAQLRVGKHSTLFCT